MAEYMVATDVLVSKAGPGTIAEAASLSLPVMLTSFLPRQEEGSVDYVTSWRVSLVPSSLTLTPRRIRCLATWLLDEEKLREMSINARMRGSDAISESALRWRNEHVEIVLEEMVGRV